MNPIDAKSVLDFLYKELKIAKISLGHAEKRNAKQDELENLYRKIAIFDYLIERTVKEI